MAGCCHEERLPRVAATDATRGDADAGRNRRKLGRAERDAAEPRAPRNTEPKRRSNTARDQQPTEALFIEAKVWPND
jgi:hypothetical protein